MYYVEGTCNHTSPSVQQHVVWISCNIPTHRKFGGRVGGEDLEAYRSTGSPSWTMLTKAENIRYLFFYLKSILLFKRGKNNFHIFWLTIDQHTVFDCLSKLTLLLSSCNPPPPCLWCGLGSWCSLSSLSRTHTHPSTLS